MRGGPSLKVKGGLVGFRRSLNGKERRVDFRKNLRFKGGLVDFRKPPLMLRDDRQLFEEPSL